MLFVRPGDTRSSGTKEVGMLGGNTTLETSAQGAPDHGQEGCGRAGGRRRGDAGPRGARRGALRAVGTVGEAR